MVQRYVCKRCNKTFSESQPLDGLRVDFGKACLAVNLLVEGTGIRAISRLTGLDPKTILNLLEQAGRNAASLLDIKVRNVKAVHIQADEMQTFVRAKQRNVEPDDLESGTFNTFLAIDRDSKLIISHLVGKWNGENALTFFEDLRQRVDGVCQLTTDGAQLYSGYDGAVRSVFGDAVHYATEIKHFGRVSRDVPLRFAPAILLGVRRRRRIGNPDLSQATTSHCERTNLSLRLFTKRYARCTLGYSKKPENLAHAIALFVWHFNFARVHSAHNLTPAQSAGLTQNVWSISDLLSTI